MFVELKGFRNFLETNPLKPNSQVLWFHLMMIANESGWKKELSIPNSVLMARTGIASKNTLTSNRNALIQANRITYRSRGRTKAGIYTMIPFGEEPSPKNEPGSSPDKVSSPKNEPETSPSSSPDSSPETGPETSPYLDIDKDVDKDNIGSGGLEGFLNFQSARAYVAAWKSVDQTMLSQLALYRKQIGEPLLAYSVQYLIDHRVTLAGVPKYLAKTVNCWLSNGVTTPEGARKYEQERQRGPRQFQTTNTGIPDIPIFNLTSEEAKS